MMHGHTYIKFVGILMQKTTRTPAYSHCRISTVATVQLVGSEQKKVVLLFQVCILHSQHTPVRPFVYCNTEENFVILRPMRLTQMLKFFYEVWDFSSR